MLFTGHVPQVLLRQLMNPIDLRRILDGSSGSAVSWRACSDNASVFEDYQVAVQTGPRDAGSFRKFPCSAGAHAREMSEDDGLRSASDHAHRGFNLRGEIGTDECWHTTILPDRANSGRVMATPYY